MANTPRIPTLSHTPTATIEAAMAAARARKLATQTGTPTVVLPTIDPVQKQLEKLKAQEAKAQAKLDRVAKRDATKKAQEAKKAERAATKVTKTLAREVAKADRLAAREQRKLDREAGKAPAAKATNRLARLLSKLSPEALDIFEAIGDVTAADAKALARVFNALATAFVPVEGASEFEVTEETEAPAPDAVAAE